MNRSQLETLITEKVLTGGKRTRAEFVRDVLDAIIESVPNIADDKDQTNGYLGINSSDMVNVSFIKESVSSKKYLKGTGAWELPFDSGNMQANGTGVLTSFVQTHNLGRAPSAVFITPRNSLSSAKCHISAITPDDFTVTFDVAPALGTNNIEFDYLVV